MIDWARVITLRDEVGREDFGEIVDLFMQEVEERLINLMNPARRPALEEDLHFLRGSALNLGFSDFARLCAAGEAVSAKSQQDQVDVDAIIRCFSLSKARFGAEIAGHLDG